MRIEGSVAIVSGGASGLGEATIRALLAAGGRAVILDRPDSAGERLAGELGTAAAFAPGDVTREADVAAAVGRASERFGAVHVAVSCAGVGAAMRTVTKDGPMPLALFARVVEINLIGTFNVIRLAAAAMARNQPNADGERGVLVNTASAAAFDGQIGQAAYSASKGGVVGLTLPVARDLAGLGIRCVTIAPGTFDTPMLAMLPEAQRQALAAQIPFPSRLGRPAEFAALVRHIVENPMLNGETIRLDGALRMPPTSAVPSRRTCSTTGTRSWSMTPTGRAWTPSSGSARPAPIRRPPSLPGARSRSHRCPARRSWRPSRRPGCPKRRATVSSSTSRPTPRRRSGESGSGSRPPAATSSRRPSRAEHPGRRLACSSSWWAASRRSTSGAARSSSSSGARSSTWARWASATRRSW
ncbi:MAG: SDR family NAD(P)-dependent oxidoreductase [Deltaproteobacteria bacterium]|nr:MAG: SDR family NAD(P)-dependent oxidoreductase [Deltaproteobacteria bacterium]